MGAKFVEGLPVVASNHLKPNLRGNADTLYGGDLGKY